MPVLDFNFDTIFESNFWAFVIRHAGEATSKLI